MSDPTVVPVASGYLHRHEDGGAEIGMAPLLGAHVAPGPLSPQGWYALACYAVGAFVVEGR